MITQLIGFVLLFALAVGLAVPVGRYLSRVFSPEKSADPFDTFDGLLYRIGGIDPNVPMTWRQYAVALLSINGVWLVYGFVMLLTQTAIPIWNQGGVSQMDWTLALNTAISFLTSTNLQHYSGESGATYFTQLLVLTFLQFVAAATSLAVGVAVVRSLKQETSNSVGNFYQDFVRSITRVFLPLSLIGAVGLLYTGVPMTFSPYAAIKTLEGIEQTVATGPVAAMLPIKHLGSNGGGFMGANTAHPFENPSMVSYIIHLINVFLLPMAFVCFVGYFLNRRKLGTIVFTIMTGCWLALTIPIMQQELAGNKAISALGIDQSVAGAPAGNMEGKEARFGVAASAFYAGVNIVIPAGTLTSMHDSYTPLSGLFMLLGMQVDAFYGGVGSGFLYMFLYIILAIFIGSLMIGRTPELLGKKVGIVEIQIASFVIVVLPLLYMGATAIAAVIQNANPDIGWLSNGGPHGFTTMLYEYVSSAGGNGSGFEGLADNTPFWNLSTAVVMLGGRYIPLLAPLAIGGILLAKRYVPPTAGVLPTESWTFGLLLTAVIIIIGALCIFPAAALGPISEFLNQ
ncbi:potassium-transporting ATPase subunit KdpA [Fibrella forsythiae]|uniref:Potassium-transporting ATPase potassium-binding subunit n=1 Tax=Fibrella forsythiae TaxID=2817061 RepID=A0ABS3JGG4_9BACT|nr:potassium-transporting ATPase subunit KdpA [Fibrella forsythiae]MBO0948508.1 potassium-transporting ATPase subunit A [Fibrella forsythiae]